MLNNNNYESDILKVRGRCPLQTPTMVSLALPTSEGLLQPLTLLSTLVFFLTPCLPITELPGDQGSDVEERADGEPGGSAEGCVPAVW